MTSRTLPHPVPMQLDTYTFALAGLARLAERCEGLDEEVRARLQGAAERAGLRTGQGLLRAFYEYLKSPTEEDAALAGVATHFGFTMIETLAVRLAVAAEEDLLAGHVLTHLQQPLAQSRPTVGLLARAYGEEFGVRAIQLLGQGTAVRCGLMQLAGKSLPLPERQVRVPLASCLALQGVQGPWPGVCTIPRHYPIPLGDSTDSVAAEMGARLFSATAPAPALVIRTGDIPEARAAAEKVCAHGQSQAVLIHTEQVFGMAPWLYLNGYVPVFTQFLAPGERKSVPVIAGFGGPTIVLTGIDGEFESDERMVIEWRLQIPLPEERTALWGAVIGEGELANRLGAGPSPHGPPHCHHRRQNERAA